MLACMASDMAERIQTLLVGDLDDDTVLVTDRLLTTWTIILYALGMFTGMGIMLVLAP